MGALPPRASPISLLYPSLLQPWERERGEQVASGGDKCLEEGGVGVDTPQEENGDRVDHPEDGEPPKPAELPCLLRFHAPVAFKDGLDLLL